MWPLRLALMRTGTASMTVTSVPRTRASRLRAGVKQPRLAPPPRAAGVVGAQRGRPGLWSGRGRADRRRVPGAPQAAGLAAHPGSAPRPPPAPRRGSVCLCFSLRPQEYPLVPGAPFTVGSASTPSPFRGEVFVNGEGEKRKKTRKGRFPVSSPFILHARAQINLGKASRRRVIPTLKIC